MDPVTHGVIGLAVSAFQGDPVSLSNPASVGCAIGAMSPDIDVVIRIIWGDYHYLKHHRGFSHSIPALIGLSFVITLGLSFLYTNFDFLNCLLWTAIGAFSHTFFDILNSYGAKLFAPFNDKKLKANLLMLYDPVITVICLFLILKRNITYRSLAISTLAFAGYILLRYFMRKRAERRVYAHFNDGYKINKIIIMPSLMAFHKWTFIVMSNSHNIVGEYNLLNDKIFVREKLKKPKAKIVELFENTKLGQNFKSFSPCYHIEAIERKGKLILQSIDLRYYFKNDFMHHATAIFDKDYNLIESFLQPYDVNKKIYI